MTQGDLVTWNGSSAAVELIRDAVIPHTSAGALRVVLQQLALRDAGGAAGSHEVIDAIVDVGGNLVVMPIAGAVRADPDSSAALDAALARLREDLVSDLGSSVDSLEVIMNADTTRQVRCTLSVDVSPEEVAGRPPHPALHDGRHHISHHAPALDELRDRMAAPAPGLLQRIRGVLNGWRRAS